MDDPPAVNIRQDTWPAWTWLVIGVARLDPDWEPWIPAVAVASAAAPVAVTA